VPKLFSNKSRPVSAGPYPTELLARCDGVDLSAVPPSTPITFSRPHQPQSIVNAMGEYQAMLDALREGRTAGNPSEIPTSPTERADHLKSFAYFSDTTIVGICRLPNSARLGTSVVNPDVERLAKMLRTIQPKSLASGIDQSMASLREAMESEPRSMDDHTHAIVFAHEFYREPSPDEPGTDWILDAEAERAALLGAEVAVVLSDYLAVLGFEARAHTPSATDVDLNQLAVSAGLATVAGGDLINPYLGDRFGVCAVTTNMEMACDLPLAPLHQQSRWRTHGPSWHLGTKSAKNKWNRLRYGNHRYVDGELPFHKIKRVEEPTTYIDEERVPRVPKRADMFARSQFGDMGPKNENATRGGGHILKSAPAAAQRRSLTAFVLLGNQAPADNVNPTTTDPERNAANLKATSHWLGSDAVGLTRCPDWTWYSHDAAGSEIIPPHDQAVAMIIDQGYETMEGASGDDWIAVSQSMRAYLRFALIGGVLAKHIRNLGYSAKPHTVMDGEVLQPPLVLLAGLGEVSRIGEVILHPFLGPRLKSGVVTTTMPQTHDRPIDFGLQRFCENCNKCARECPSGAITAGPKLMFNGYEIWKSDSQKCTTYRVTNAAGAMCGRCMKTCPWNLEGLFGERPFRWLATNVPFAAKWLARLDDALGHGSINPIKKWWWDLRLEPDGAYRPVPVELVNKRELQTEIELDYSDQTLAVYPAHLAPHPWPFPFPMDREKGIEAYQAMITAKEHKARLLANKVNGLVPTYTIDGDAPVVRVQITNVAVETPLVSIYDLQSVDGTPLPPWDAGAHVDVVIAPGFLRQYSLCGNPSDRSRYQIAVLRETEGRGGSNLLHRLFVDGRKIFISKPINHFPFDPTATKAILFGGGIGITPMIAMAHEAYALGLDFEIHYSVTTRADAAFESRLTATPWSDRATVHVSDEGSRANLGEILGEFQPGHHVYVCGPSQYMEAVMGVAVEAGFPDEAFHSEYFSVPDLPQYEDHEFTLRLDRSGRDIHVRADQSATEALGDAGIQVDLKCSDGICGVCKVGLVDGLVQHRDFVLSEKQRETSIILCQSRAQAPQGVVTIEL